MGTKMNKFYPRLVMTVFFMLPLAALAAGMSVFDSTGEPKAKGVQVQVSYPAGFENAEHTGDEVRKLTRRRGDIEETLMLHVVSGVSETRVKQSMPVPGALLQEERYRLWKQRLTGENAWVREIRDTTSDARPAVFIAGTDRIKQRGKRAYSQSEVLSVYDGKNIIMLSCTVSGPEEKKAAVDRWYAKSSKALCQPFLGSLRFAKSRGVTGRDEIDRMDDEIFQQDDGGPGGLCRRNSPG